jgi:CheY-like chemotaxis protein
MLKILLIEDNVIDIMAFIRLFEKNCCQTPVHIVANDLEALAILYRIKCLLDKSMIFERNILLILELYLLEMNGIDFLNELQYNSILKQIPVIILGEIFFEDRKQIENYNINLLGYLKKPIIFSELVQLITISGLQLSFNEVLLSNS